LSIFNKAYNAIFSSDKELVTYIKAITGVTPSKLKLYKQVFSHRSLFSDMKENNERLELLGDSVLDMLVAEFLFKKYPYKEEGFITELRAKIVNRKSLNKVGEKLGLVEKLNLNRKAMTDLSKDLGGNTFEALIGALYLDAGFEPTKKFVFKRVLQQMVDVENLEVTETDFKSKIYQIVQKQGKNIEFRVGEEIQKGKRTYFVIYLEINGQLIAKGEGFNKKTAEQSASMNALAAMEEPILSS
jgi:ribonuclease-3